MTLEQQQALMHHAMRARADAWSDLIATAGKAVLTRVAGLYRAGQAARARRELYALSDRMLKDIGLSRSEIDSLLR